VGQLAYSTSGRGDPASRQAQWAVSGIDRLIAFQIRQDEGLQSGSSRARRGEIEARTQALKA